MNADVQLNCQPGIYEVGRERNNTIMEIDDLDSDKPNQPKSFKFPLRTFGKRTHSFQVAWFQRWPWLHYIEHNDTVVCHLCVQAHKTSQLSSSKADHAFIETGYSNWKHGTETKVSARMNYLIAIKRQLVV